MQTHLSRPMRRASTPVVRARLQSAPYVVLVAAAALTGCGGGGDDQGVDAYVERYARACDALVAIGSEYEQRLSAVATTSALSGERETVERIRGPVASMLDRTVRTYAPLRDADAPSEWRAFQSRLRERLDEVVPTLTEMRRRVAAARSRADVVRATAAVRTVAGAPQLRVPASLVERAPACRVLAESGRA